MKKWKPGDYPITIEDSNKNIAISILIFIAGIAIGLAILY
jgi:hypothetical protein